MYSLEDLLAASAHSNVPGSRFSDVSEGDEDEEEQDGEEEEQGEVDLWQSRGRAPRTAVMG